MSADPKRPYTLTPAARAQRAAAAATPRPRREWTNCRVSAAVLGAIDAARGPLSRNDHLARLHRVRDPQTP